MKSSQIRDAFADFFKENGHRLIGSSPLVPPDDPTLLFTTAGMVQFKPLYAGLGELPYRRACSVQKCMRAGGKGSDLENVGRTLRHFTFFEMLGNFSFGDYFKQEAILWAWEFSTKRVGLDPTRIYASVYEDDDEAWDIWTRQIGIPEDRMVRLGARDNFWGPAGDTGACGPCSELYYDRGEKYGAGLSFQHATIHDEDPGSRYLEFWNCVFPQFDQQKDGSRPLLKNRGVDTGMGLERLCCLVQDKESPYQTDLLFPIVTRACELLGIGDYTLASMETRQVANVAADHVRALTFVMSEGIMPGNEGRGYVMRRLLRRAARFARKAGCEKPFLYELVDTVIDTMGPVYPDIRKSAEVIKSVIRAEEEAYSLTLGAGLQRLENVLMATAENPVLSGSDIFQLTATYGLPLDDILEIAAERSVTLDLDSYHEHVETHRTGSRKIGKAHKLGALADQLRPIYDQHGKTDFEGYPPGAEFYSEAISSLMGGIMPDDDDSDEELTEEESRVIDITRFGSDNGQGNIQDIISGEFVDNLKDQDREIDDYFPAFSSVDSDDDDDDDEELLLPEDLYPVEASYDCQVLALFKNEQPVDKVEEGDEVAIILDRTPFYAESGGQVTDVGEIEAGFCKIEITDVVKSAEEIYVHFGKVLTGELNTEDHVDCMIDVDRRWAVMQNHTATHLLQGALRTIFGETVSQQGSYVGPDYLRFDFTCPRTPSGEELELVERLVNHQVTLNTEVVSQVMDLEEARSLPGIIAPFGEKYGQSVRVVAIEDFDVEFCGGTHARRTGDIGSFIIRSEGAVSSGVRRIEAVTGAGAYEHMIAERASLREVAETLKVSRKDVPSRVRALTDELKTLRRTLTQLEAKASGGDSDSALSSAPEIDGIKIVRMRCGSADAAALRQIYDKLKSQRPSGLFALVAGSTDNKVTLIAGATPDVVARGVAAGDIIRQVAPVVGGKGGGKAEMAQAGGNDATKLDEALKQAVNLVQEILTGKP